MSIGWYLIPRSSMASSRAPTTCSASCRSAGDENPGGHCDCASRSQKRLNDSCPGREEGAAELGAAAPLRGSLWPRPRDNGGGSAGPTRQHLHARPGPRGRAGAEFCPRHARSHALGSTAWLLWAARASLLRVSRGTKSGHT